MMGLLDPKSSEKKKIIGHSFIFVLVVYLGQVEFFIRGTST